jgi:membrane protease YdiL (CAAX protease family)
METLPAPPPCAPRVHFHIALAGIFVPLVGLITSFVLALRDRACPGQDIEHRRWTRRLLALIGIDILVVASLLTLDFRAEEPARGLSGPVARIVPGPRIGVTFDPASPEARIKMVVPDMAAARAGLRPGDLIVAIDQDDMKSEAEVRAAILRGTAGVGRRFRIDRAGERLEIDVVPVEIGPRRLMDVSPERGGIPWLYGLVWILPVAAIGGISRLVARRRKAPRVVIWSPVIMALLGSGAAVVGTVYAVRAIMGGWSIFGVILSLFAQMLAMLLVVGASRRWLGPVAPGVQAPEPRLSWLRTTGWGVFYLLTGFPRVAILLHALNKLVFWVKPGPDAIEMLARMQLGVPGALMLVVVVVFLGPIAEEVLFRGFLLPRLAAQLGGRWALWASALLFASLHFYYGIHTLLILYYGLVLGWARMRSGGLASPILLHVLINGVVMALLLSRL